MDLLGWVRRIGWKLAERLQTKRIRLRRKNVLLFIDANYEDLVLHGASVCPADVELSVFGNNLAFGTMRAKIWSAGAKLIPLRKALRIPLELKK